MRLPYDTRGSESTAEALAAGSRVILVQRGAQDVSGALTARFEARESAWLVRRFLIRGPADSQARIFAGEPAVTTLADGTSAGDLDVADYAQPLYVPPTVPLVVVWTHRDTGANVADPDRLALVRAEIEDI